MNAVIGDLLPLAVTVAISPVPIIATIMVLLAPRAGATSTGFLLGWVAGIVAATVVFTSSRRRWGWVSRASRRPRRPG